MDVITIHNAYPEVKKHYNIRTYFDEYGWRVLYTGKFYLGMRKEDFIRISKRNIKCNLDEKSMYHTLVIFNNKEDAKQSMRNLIMHKIYIDYVLGGRNQ